MSPFSGSCCTLLWLLQLLTDAGDDNTALNPTRLAAAALADYGWSCMWQE